MRGVDEPRKAEHGITAIEHARRARVIGLAGDVNAPAAVGQDRRTHRNRRTEVDQSASLLDMELDESADAREALRLCAERLRVPSRPTKCLVHRDAIRVAQSARLLRSKHPCGEARSDAGDAEAPALLVRETGDGERATWLHAAPLQLRDRSQGARDAERAVVVAAIGHGIEVRSRDERVTGAGIPPPCPDVAVAIGLDVEPEARGLPDEPLAQRQVGIGPREAPVAARGRVAADGRDVREMAGNAHASSRIGTRTPRSSATSSASS